MSAYLTAGVLPGIKSRGEQDAHILESLRAGVSCRQVVSLRREGIASGKWQATCGRMMKDER